MEDYILIGIVRKVRGNKGDLKVEPMSDVSERFDNMDTALIRKNGSTEVVEFKLEKSELVNEYVVMKIDGVDSYDEASAFLGSEILIPESERGSLPSDTYFIDSLVGMNVKDSSGKKIGVVTDVHSANGTSRRSSHSIGQDLILIETVSGSEFSLPFVKEFVKEIDPDKREMRVELIEGMIEGGIDEN